MEKFLKTVKPTKKVKIVHIRHGRVSTRRRSINLWNSITPSLVTASSNSATTSSSSSQREPLNQTPVSDVNQEEFSDRRQKFLDGWSELRSKLVVTHLEELSPATRVCSCCGEVVENIVFCQDCGPMAYYCMSCCYTLHKTVMFHSPQVWKSSFYVPVDIQYHFKRCDNHCCDTEYISSVYAIDVKGNQHCCKVNLCRCENPCVTLMRYRLWPSSPQKPRIVFDMKFMELIASLQLECHVPAKAFCDALISLQSDYILLSHDFPKDVYRALVGDSQIEYHFYRSSLRSCFNIRETAFGRECPVCEQNPPIISLDANFGLVHKASSGRGKGASRHKDFLFANNIDFKSFIDDYSFDKKNQAEDCSQFQAGSVLRSKRKMSKLDVTGLFGAICKHDIPICFIDMIHGERLGYAVYVLTKLMEKDTTSVNKIVMYDISCTLHKHLQKTENFQLLDHYKFSVPIFHSFAHNLDCQLKYGQRYVTGTGLTDGEGIERLWSYLRRFKRITKEMSYDNRCDLLTEAVLHKTSQIISDFGTRLHNKLQKAEKTISNCSEIISSVTTNMNVDIDSAKNWLMKWKSELDNVPATNLNSEELYVENLYVSQMKRHILETGTTDLTEKKKIERDLESLKKERVKLKKNVCNSVVESDFNFENEPLNHILKSARKKRRIGSLENLRQYSSERQYLSSLMKKYAGMEIDV